LFCDDCYDYLIVGQDRVVSKSQSLAGRYASALYELADQGRCLDNVASDLANFSKLIDESKALDRLIRSPVISREDQLVGMDSVLNKANVNALTKKFIGAVIMNRRLFVINDIIMTFLEELAERRGETKAKVTSAVKLTADQAKKLNTSLNKALGQKVSLSFDVDETLIGGLIVRVGSRMIDSSIRTKLQRLQIAMKGVG
jgi:F-type H+-transporting ATPase subunit delta